MRFTLLNILSIVGSLGFFMFGMKIMSEAIQKIAGSSMRRTLEPLSSNRARGIFSGFLITSLIQSSSATTVLAWSQYWNNRYCLAHFNTWIQDKYYCNYLASDWYCISHDIFKKEQYQILGRIPDRIFNIVYGS